jgi:hypothetical protein
MDMNITLPEFIRLEMTKKKLKKLANLKTREKNDIEEK